MRSSILCLLLAVLTPAPALASVGALIQAQLWHRDPFNTSNQTATMSDAIEFTVTP